MGAASRTGPLFFVASLTLAAQGGYIITTVAGGAAAPPTPTLAVNASVGHVQAAALDSAGNVYFSSSLHCVFKVDASGVMTRVAGTCRPGYSGDGGPATTAQLNSPYGVTVDPAGNLYIADSYNNTIRKVSPAGTITTVVGTGVYGYSGDGGPAAGAQLWDPLGVALDTAGNLYIADTKNNSVRKVSAAGTITTVAGNGTHGYSGDGGPAASATLTLPFAVTVDSAQNLYIADSYNYRVRKVSQTGIITTVAGGGGKDPVDGGLATSAGLSYLFGIVVDAAGNLYISDAFLNRVYRVSPGGIITAVAGNGSLGSAAGYSGDGGPATNARLNLPSGIALDSAGSLYIADSDNDLVRKVTPAGIITTVAGNGAYVYSGDGGPTASAQLYQPEGVAVDAAGNLYIADAGNNRVRRVFPGGIIATVAGNGSPGYSGDGGPASIAQLSRPEGVAVDAASNLYIADANNGRIRKVTPAGIITTVAGGGNAGLGDGGPATSATFYTYSFLGSPFCVTLDSAGNLYIADDYRNLVRKVSPAGIITTVAGNGNGGYSGDGGPATSAQLSDPSGMAVDAAGNLYIADANNGRIRRVTPSGIITTVAGGGTAGLGDDGPATSAQLFGPSGVAVDAAGNLYIADTAHSRVRKVSPGGIITTVAGTGSYGYSGDGGAATSAQLASPSGLAVDSTGNIYVADSGGNAIRLLQPVERGRQRRFAAGGPR